MYATLLQSDKVQPYGREKAGKRPGLRKKPQDLSANEIEERGHGKGVGVYATLVQSAQFEKKKGNA